MICRQEKQSKIYTYFDNSMLPFFAYVQVYQIYARRSPEEVHSILRSAGADYVVLENSICYERRHRRGCRLRDLLDLANGHVGGFYLTWLTECLFVCVCMCVFMWLSTSTEISGLTHLYVTVSAFLLSLFLSPPLNTTATPCLFILMLAVASLAFWISNSKTCISRLSSVLCKTHETVSVGPCVTV